MASTFLTAEWRKLIMAQYAVDPATLTHWLPAGLELDLFRGTCYVSLVGFLFDQVRIKGWRVPLHTRFEEVNLRFYVRRVEADGSTKRGVVFIREFVPRMAITLIAKTFYEEPYVTLPTRHRIESTPELLQVRYDWRFRGSWHRLSVEASPAAEVIAPGSEEEFITEHYWGFTKRRDGRTSAYEVQHPRWRIYPIQRFEITTDLAALYGPAFTNLKAASPVSILLAEGSEVSVHSEVRV